MVEYGCLGGYGCRGLKERQCKMERQCSWEIRGWGRRCGRWSMADGRKSYESEKAYQFETKSNKATTTQSGGGGGGRMIGGQRAAQRQ